MKTKDLESTLMKQLGLFRRPVKSTFNIFENQKSSALVVVKF